MPEYVRVKDKATGHEYTIREDQLDSAAHVKVDAPAFDAHGEPAPPKYRTSVAKKAAEKKASPTAAATSSKEK